MSDSRVYFGMNVRTAEAVGVEDMLRCNPDVQSSYDDVIDAREYVHHRIRYFLLMALLTVNYVQEILPISHQATNEIGPPCTCTCMSKFPEASFGSCHESKF